MKFNFKSTVFLAIVACFLWSTAFAVVKIGLEYSTPLRFAGSRFFLAGLLLIPVFGSLKAYFTAFISNIKFILLIGVMQVMLQYTFFYSGLNLVPAAIGAIVIGSQPLFISIISHFWFQHDKMTWNKILSIIIGIAGIILISLSRGDITLQAGTEFLGVFLLMMTNILSGLSNVVIAGRKRNMPAMALSSGQLWTGGLMLFIASIFFEGRPTLNLPVEYYLSLGWLSALSAVAITIWFTLLRRPGVKVSELNIWKFLIPLSGAALSWILIKSEKPDIIQISGMVMIVISLIVLHARWIIETIKRRKFFSAKKQAG